MKPVATIMREFDQLSQGSICIDPGCLLAATAPCNASKNRYGNILARDDTRVRLDNYGMLGLDSDYVNANHIKLDEDRKAPHYISTQAPLPATVAAFWLMVWEQQCPLVMMLTRLIEKEKRKASVYWPEMGASATFGPLSVHCIADSLGSPVRRRRFRIDVDGAPSRVVEHVYYMAWPDFGLPEANEGLLQLLQIADEVTQGRSDPLVVHCSAGVGRSGTFIGIHALYSRMRRDNSLARVNIPECILQMRRSRVGMVQTKEQYLLIYHVLWELRQRLSLDGAAQQQPSLLRTSAPADVDPAAHGLVKRGSDSQLLGSGKRRPSYLSRSAMLPSNHSNVFSGVVSPLLESQGQTDSARTASKALSQSRKVYPSKGLRESHPRTSSEANSVSEEDSSFEVAQYGEAREGSSFALFALGE